MTVEEAEQEVYGIYQWFHREAPGTRVVEQGRLAQLWAYLDLCYEEEYAA